MTVKSDDKSGENVARKNSVKTTRILLGYDEIVWALGIVEEDAQDNT